MESGAGTSKAADAGRIAEAVRADPRAGGMSPGATLLVAACIGLAAGWIDLGLMLLNSRVIQRDFDRLGGDFPWLIPSGVAALLLSVGAALAGLYLVRRRRPSPRWVVGVLAFIASLDACARLPLELWASLLLSAGLAVQSGRWAGRRPDVPLAWARRAVPLLAAALLAAVMVTRGGRAWAEHRAVSSLPPASANAPNVLLIVWDTVRAASTSLHGYGRPTTPNLQRLAARGTRFDLAFSTSSWTLPAHASLFTGRWPHELGVDWKSPLRRDVPTVAGHLRDRGYDTAGFVANLDYASVETGLSRGFAHYEDYPVDLLDTLDRYVGLGHRMELSTWGSVVSSLLEKASGRPMGRIGRSREHAKRATDVDRGFLDWLSWQRGRARPFFAFLNYNDAHSPYEVPDPSAPGFGLRPTTLRDYLTLQRWNQVPKASLRPEDVQMATAVYDECIAHLDRRLGLLLDELDRRGVLGNTIVIVTADHGEHLGDHLLFFHGCSLYRQLVHVPLVIVDPRGAATGRVVAGPVGLRDLPATIAELVGEVDGAPFPGRSLARSLRDAAGPPGDAPGPLLMETTPPLVMMNEGREPVAKGPMRSLVAGGLHYIESGDGTQELFSLEGDPEERFNLANAPTAGDVVRRFRSSLESMASGRKP
ncbi:Choline-sulfatase [Aquisphaera giovannonii]|uniref:Choline-sulfatase n=1 Tax=Aquisphaera giovannonii TaxID=406548 RepID=A0A5B9W2K0_9BACT|nr:sulfatase [Aquisphaera giovannonii]QEH34519.1 Choline-sulfatase [Aquisphaera giovannonii]